MSCDKCRNPRKKTYQHVSGQELCYGHLREAALNGRRDFRTRRKSVTDELSEREPDDIKMIENASVDELRGMEKVLTDEINRRRRLLNGVRKRIRQPGTAAKHLHGSNGK